MPHFTLIRPGDANEAVEAWRVAMKHMDGPVGLVLSRQKLPVFDRSQFGAASGVAQGAYVLAESSKQPTKLILMATGSELGLAMDARTKLEGEGIGTRVVSIPSWELFDRQPASYRESVLPGSLRARLAIEAGAGLGWKRYVGDAGDSISLDRFGASAPGDVVMRELGYSVENVVRRAKALL